MYSREVGATAGMLRPCLHNEVRFGGWEPESGPHDNLLVPEAAGMEVDMQLTLEYVDNIHPQAGGKILFTIPLPHSSAYHGQPCTHGKPLGSNPQGRLHHVQVPPFTTIFHPTLNTLGQHLKRQNIRHTEEC